MHAVLQGTQLLSMSKHVQTRWPGLEGEHGLHVGVRVVKGVGVFPVEQLVQDKAAGVDVRLPAWHQILHVFGRVVAGRTLVPLLVVPGCCFVLE